MGSFNFTRLPVTLTGPPYPSPQPVILNIPHRHPEHTPIVILNLFQDNEKPSLVILEP